MQTLRYDLDIMKVGLGNQNCVPCLCRLVQAISNPSTSDSKHSTPSLEYCKIETIPSSKSYGYNKITMN